MPRVRRSPPDDVCDTVEEIDAYYEQTDDSYWDDDYDPEDDR